MQKYTKTALALAACAVALATIAALNPLSMNPAMRMSQQPHPEEVIRATQPNAPAPALPAAPKAQRRFRLKQRRKNADNAAGQPHQE